MTNILALDIGGTKIAAALVNRQGQILYRAELPSCPDSEDKMFKQVVACLYLVINQMEITAEEVGYIGVGVPGKVNVEKGIAVYQNNLPWRDFPLASHLQKEFPNAQIILDNDVYMAAYGEWSARGLEEGTFVYLTISTGISSSIIWNGQFLRGAGVAGEIGLSYVENQTNTIETSASGPAIANRGRQLYKDEHINTKLVLEKYKENDPIACSILEETALNVAKGIHQIFCVLDPSHLVIGGGVVNYQYEYFELIKSKLASLIQHPIQETICTRVELSTLKQDAGIIGAAFRSLKK